MYEDILSIYYRIQGNKKYAHFTLEDTNYRYFYIQRKV